MARTLSSKPHAAPRMQPLQVAVLRKARPRARHPPRAGPSTRSGTENKSIGFAPRNHSFHLSKA